MNLPDNPVPPSSDDTASAPLSAEEQARQDALQSFAQEPEHSPPRFIGVGLSSISIMLLVMAILRCCSNYS